MTEMLPTYSLPGINGMCIYIYIYIYIHATYSCIYLCIYTHTSAMKFMLKNHRHEEHPICLVAIHPGIDPCALRERTGVEF